MNERSPRESFEATGAEAQPRDGPRIYAASLSDYNSGVLHGVWVDVSDDVVTMEESVGRMLADSPSARTYGEVAEEWAVHDYEGFGPLQLDEYTSITKIAQLGRGIQEQGMAYAAWVGVVGADDEGAETFNEVYRGEWESVTAYAEELLDDLGARQLIDEAPEWIRPYLRLDVEAFARDLQLGGDIVTADRPEGGVWIYGGC